MIVVAMIVGAAINSGVYVAQTGVNAGNLSSGTWWAGLGIAAGAGAAAGAAGYGAGVGIAYAVGPAFAASLGGGVLIGSGAGTASALASYSTSWMGTGLAKALGLNMSTAGYSVGGMAKAGLTGAVSGAVSGGIGSGFVGTAAGTATGVGFGYAAWGEDVSWKSAGIAFAAAYSGMLMSSSLSDDASQATARNTAGRAAGKSANRSADARSQAMFDRQTGQLGAAIASWDAGHMLAENGAEGQSGSGASAQGTQKITNFERAAWTEVLLILTGEKLAAWAARAVVTAVPSLCFPASTLVHAAEGLVPIEEIEPGDLVWSEDELTGKLLLRRVTRTFVTADQPLVEILVEGPDGTAEGLMATTEHPFWTCRGWVPAGELLKSDSILQRSRTWSQVVGVTATELRTTVYNFEVDGYHTYFVGVQGLLVHNTCFPDAKTLAKVFNATKDSWHRTVKPEILKDAAEFMKQIGSKNPDIGVDQAGKIMLRNPQTGQSVVTDLLKDWFIR